MASHSNIRREQVIKRKNFFPTLIITIFLWLITSALVYFIEPDILGAIPLFFILIFLDILFTFSLLFANGRRGLIGSIGITLFLILAYLGVGNILNFLLIIAIGVTTEFYFMKR